MKLILTGGFLGSGKTTAIVNGARILMDRGIKVGVITNDQGDDQVDTVYVRSLGIPSGEVASGCFCCRYNDFLSQMNSLVSDHHPEVIFAEAVGSCTDLVATIARPLIKSSPGLNIVISVFVDSVLLSAILENRASFIAESVRYIFKKQLEEADVIVVNKSDLSKVSQIELIEKMIGESYPGKRLLFQNSNDDKDIAGWLEELMNYMQEGPRQSLDIDYAIYGSGEAELTWCDRSLNITSPFHNSVDVVRAVIGKIFDHVQEFRMTIGHLKFFVGTESGSRKISFATMSSSAFTLDLPEAQTANLLINARIQTSPAEFGALLNKVIEETKHKYRCEIVEERSAIFRPGFPVPTHRLVD
jgi:Ni2+-binding GTPase involved in maturation of urease and hydrogenase